MSDVISPGGPPRWLPTLLPPAPALATNNAGAEAATEWVFAHMEDADFNDPLPAPGPAAGTGGAGGAAAAGALTTATAGVACPHAREWMSRGGPTQAACVNCAAVCGSRSGMPDPQPIMPAPTDPEAVSNLTAMGFSEDAASTALAACGGSLERAADWLFSHMDDLESAVAAAKAAAAGSGANSGPAVTSSAAAPAAK